MYGSAATAAQVRSKPIRGSKPIRRSKTIVRSKTIASISFPCCLQRLKPNFFFQKSPLNVCIQLYN